MSSQPLRAPFPYFGGKRDVASLIWERLGIVRQYIEPFCGSAAVLLAAPRPASLEIAGDANGFLANFWRATKYQPAEVAREADYPVSHIDLGARHVWLMSQRDRLGADLQDPLWPGDARVAGWWLWGQCCWIGSGWCEWMGKPPGSANTQDDGGVQAIGKIPHAGDAGRGVQALGQIPHAGNAGRGVMALGQRPHAGNAGMGVQAIGKIPSAGNAGRGVQAVGQVPRLDWLSHYQADSAIGDRVDAQDGLLTSSGRTAWRWLHQLAERLERVRVVHGAWDRCLNHHYGGESTAVFLDPPYRAYEALYGSAPVADAVEDWARQNPQLRVAVCGHIGDYPSLDAAGFECVPWTRKRLTYSGGETTDKEAIWFSPACLTITTRKQMEMFGT